MFGSFQFFKYFLVGLLCCHLIKNVFQGVVGETEIFYKSDFIKLCISCPVFKKVLAI